MSSNNLTYGIINTIDIDNVDFQEVVQERSTVRYSLDGLKFVIKWNTGNTPSFIESGLVVPDAILTHAECLALMSTAEWSEQIN